MELRFIAGKTSFQAVDCSDRRASLLDFVNSPTKEAEVSRTTR